MNGDVHVNTEWQIHTLYTNSRCNTMCLYCFSMKTGEKNFSFLIRKPDNRFSIHWVYSTARVLIIFQSNEVANSNAMELEGLKRCLQTLADEDIAISDITTDRHPQVKKFMREQRPEVNHWFDVWHVAKGM